MGQDLWEEVDIIIKGGNYGWNVLEGFHHYKPGPPGAQYIDPVIEYPHNPALLKESQFPRHAIGACVVGGYVIAAGNTRRCKESICMRIMLWGPFMDCATAKAKSPITPRFWNSQKTSPVSRRMPMANFMS